MFWLLTSYSFSDWDHINTVEENEFVYLVDGFYFRNPNDKNLYIIDTGNSCTFILLGKCHYSEKLSF